MAAKSGNVRIVLAHHLDRDGAQLLPGDEIEVPEYEARKLISAGYVAGVDPGDPEAVRTALAPVERKPAMAKPPANKAAGTASA